MWTMAATVLVAMAMRPEAQPRSPAVDTPVLAGIDALVHEAITARLMPGAVVLVGLGDEVAYEKAFGQRATSRRPSP